MDEPWPGLREPRRPQGRKKPASSVLVCVPFPGRSFLQEAAREKPGNKSGWRTCMKLRIIRLTISSNWIVNGDDSVSCDSMLAIRKERKRIDPVRWWTSVMIDARMKERGSWTGSLWFNSRNFEMKANLKSGEEGPRKISQSDPSNSKFRSLYPMFSGAAVSSLLDIAWSAEIPGIVFVPFAISSLLTSNPVLDYPSSLSLPFSLSLRCQRGGFEFPAERGGRVRAERQRCASRRKGKWWKRRKTRVGYLIRARESFLQRVLHYPRQEIREKFEHPPR